MKNIAVITGASSGMGREFVLQLSREKSFDEIWVIARRTDRLESLRDEVKTPIRPISLDLTKEESISEYARLLEAENPNVSVLVNASGVGLFGTFSEMPLSDLYRMIDLNSKAYVGMTYATLPYLTNG
ncbi:MAG: SDR family NAD(P)-dependent oxidoreductase, partial [Clostridia bacterium]|nr:SDR family NAD(P)-dependent oxidoreductase [Clostridia bacterium]